MIVREQQSNEGMDGKGNNQASSIIVCQLMAWLVLSIVRLASSTSFKTKKKKRLTEWDTSFQ
jgi:hypothetical protein